MLLIFGETCFLMFFLCACVCALAALSVTIQKVLEATVFKPVDEFYGE